MLDIKFGTDGYRAIIAKEFTFETLTRISKGVSQYLKKSLPERKTIVVGYDRRFLSKEFAKATCATFAKEGFKVFLTNDFAPTPCLSYWAKYMENCAGAVVITASHNPPDYNGFKFKETFGGSALLATTQAFEKEIEKIENNGDDLSLFESFLEKGVITMFDPMPQYVQKLKSLVDVDAIVSSRFNVGVDTMFGSASKHFEKLLHEFNVKTHVIHDELNPSFNQTAPEPIFKNIQELSKMVVKQKLDCGFANDGDADRLGAIDENGNYFSTQMILSSVYWHMVVNRKKQWNISRSVSTTALVDLIAHQFNLKCIETPVGFKYIAQNIVEGDAQIGGEESGGIGIVDHLPERDGFLTALLLLEFMAKSKMKLAKLYQDICRQVRPYEFERLDLKVSKDIMEKALISLKETPPKQWMNVPVKSIQVIDGFKYYLEDGSWLLIRPSGTEPLFRLYAEAQNTTMAKAMVEAAKAHVMKNA